MKVNFTWTIRSLGVFLALSLATSCFPSALTKRTGANGTGSESIVATIGGLEPGDDKRDEIKYQLVCKDNVVVVGKLKDDKLVEFDDPRLKDGLECAMEVSAKADPIISSWYAVDKNGSPIVGLYYSSSFGTIKARRLSLALFKLYSTPPSDPFWADMVVTFPADAILAATAKLSANLSCPTGQLSASAPQDVAGIPPQRRFTFKDLSLGKLKGTSCSKLTILAEKAPVFEATLETGAVNFNTAELRKTMLLSPVTVKPVAVSSDKVGVDTRAAIECSRYEQQTKDCVEFKLPRANNNIWYAVVAATDAANNPVRYVVSGAGGLKPDSAGPAKALATMQTAMATAGAATAAHSFYAIEDLPKLKEAVLTETLSATLKPLAATVLIGVKLVKFEEIYAHGFFEYTSDEIAKFPAARSKMRWLAFIEATKPNSAEKQQLIVTGATRLFESQRLANGQVFGFDEYVKDNGTVYFQYGYAGSQSSAELKIPTSCGLPQSFYLDDLSTRFDEGLNSSAQNPEIDGCFIPFADRKALTGWTATSKVYVFGWRQLVLKI